MAIDLPLAGEIPARRRRREAPRAEWPQQWVGSVSANSTRRVAPPAAQPGTCTAPSQRPTDPRSRGHVPPPKRAADRPPQSGTCNRPKPAADRPETAPGRVRVPGVPSASESAEVRSGRRLPSREFRKIRWHLFGLDPREAIPKSVGEKSRHRVGERRRVARTRAATRLRTRTGCLQYVPKALDRRARGGCRGFTWHGRLEIRSSAYQAAHGDRARRGWHSVSRTISLALGASSKQIRKRLELQWRPPPVRLKSRSQSTTERVRRDVPS